MRFVDDYHGYEISFGYPYEITVFSNSDSWRNNPRHTSTRHMIDGIELIAHYHIPILPTGQPSAFRTLYLSFSIGGMPYTIEKIQFATKDQFQTRLDQFLQNTITPAIVNRQKGAVV